jgi:ABC-2 type transport system permease protein
MIALLDVERIKLFSTRGAWWCLGMAIVSTLAFSTLAGAQPEDAGPLTVADSQTGTFLGQVIFMLLAVVAVTGEHRYGTVRPSYLAVPRRWQVLAAKAGTLALLGLALGTVLALASLALTGWLAPDADLALRDAADWRVVGGVGLVYAVGAVIGVAVGSLLRHAAGAVSLLLVWILIVETTVVLLPGGEGLLALMPFQAQAYFAGQLDADFPYPPVFGIVYAAAVAVVLLGAAMLSTQRRDVA